MFKTGKYSDSICGRYFAFILSSNVPDAILRKESRHCKNLLEKLNLSLQEVHMYFNQATVEINRSALEMKDTRVSFKEFQRSFKYSLLGMLQLLKT